MQATHLLAVLMDLLDMGHAKVGPLLACLAAGELKDLDRLTAVAKDWDDGVAGLGPVFAAARDYLAKAKIKAVLVLTADELAALRNLVGYFESYTAEEEHRPTLDLVRGSLLRVDAEYDEEPSIAELVEDLDKGG